MFRPLSSVRHKKGEKGTFLTVKVCLGLIFGPHPGPAKILLIGPRCLPGLAQRPAAVALPPEPPAREGEEGWPDKSFRKNKRKRREY